MVAVEVIKYEGDNSTFVWKHPCEDFNSLTQLIVHETQEAVFVMNGQVLDIFGAGRYTLETQNIPLLGRVLRRSTRDKTPFHCEVFFINKTEQMAIKWGTDSRVEFIEPTYGFPLSIGASGEMVLRAENSKKLLLKLVGTESDLSQASLVRYFRACLVTRVKSYLAQTIKKQKINIFEIDERLHEISKELTELLRPDFEEYGVCLERFLVINVAKPDGEAQYEKFKSLHFRQYADIAEAKLRQQVSVLDAQTEAQKIVIDSQAQAQKRVQEGYTYQQERGFDVAEQAAKNEAVGQITSLGIGLGIMSNIGSAVGGAVGNAMENAFNVANPAKPEEKLCFCDNCGAKLVAGAAFCDDCGTPILKPVDVCVNCGYKFERAGRFCPKCGVKR